MKKSRFVLVYHRKKVVGAFVHVGVDGEVRVGRVNVELDFLVSGRVDLEGDP